jgi:hypothetical protein
VDSGGDEIAETGFGLFLAFGLADARAKRCPRFVELNAFEPTHHHFKNKALKASFLKWRRG